MGDRRRGFSTAQQLTALAPLLLVWAVGVAGLALAMLRAPDGRAELFLDPTATGQLPWWTGVYAEIGAVGWTVAAASAAFGWFVARVGGRPGAARFLRSGAALCGLYLVDAVVQLHARVLPRTGVPKQAWLVVFGIVTAWWVLASRDELRRTRWQVLLAGGVAMAVAVAIDVGLRPRDGLGVLAEDSAKFLGILAVAAYFTFTTRDIVGSILARLRPAGPRPVTAPRPATASRAVPTRG